MAQYTPRFFFVLLQFRTDKGVAASVVWLLFSLSACYPIYRTTILPIVLYGCETWSLTLREECRLRVCENRMLRRIFGPKRDEVTGEWRRLHKDELCAVYSSPDIILVIKSRRLRWAAHVARMGERRGAYRAGNLREGDHFEDPDVDGRMLLKWTFERLDGKAYSGSIWLRTGTSGGLL
jgi:hypothetical protein